MLASWRLEGNKINSLKGYQQQPETSEVQYFLTCYSMHELMLRISQDTLNVNMTTLTIPFVFSGSLAGHAF